MQTIEYIGNTKKAGIYAIWFMNSPITEYGHQKVYIGLTKGFKGRKAAHLKDFRANKHNNVYFQNAFNKYGEDAFRFEIIEICEPNNSILSEKEIQYIKSFNSTSREFGYNIKQGGFAPEITDEIREKLRIANTGKKCSDETKQKLRKANLGKKIPRDVVEKISQKLRGRKLWSEDDKKVIAERMKGNRNGEGRIVSDYAKEQTSKANKGNTYNLGKKRPKEVIDKIRATRIANGKIRPKWTEERRVKFEQSNFKHSEETKRKIAEASKRMWDSGQVKEDSEETRQRKRLAATGRIPSEETRKKLSEAHKKTIHTAEWNKKVSEALKGKSLSDETKAKISAAGKGRVPTEQARINMSNAQLRRAERLKQEKLLINGKGM